MDLGTSPPIRLIPCLCHAASAGLRTRKELVGIVGNRYRVFGVLGAPRTARNAAAMDASV